MIRAVGGKVEVVPGGRNSVDGPDGRACEGVAGARRRQGEDGVAAEKTADECPAIRRQRVGALVVDGRRSVAFAYGVNEECGIGVLGEERRVDGSAVENQADRGIRAVVGSTTV